MLTPTTQPDLIVIGGGLIGLATACEAVAKGLTVSVLDRGEPGGGASHAAAGMLSPLGEASSSGAYLRFGLSSLRMYREWVEEVEEKSGVEVEFRECGKIRLALSPSEEEDLRDRLQWAEELGLSAEWLTPGRAGELLPGVAAGVSGGLLVLDDFRVSSRRLSRALGAAARAAGVEIRSETGVRAIRTEEGRATGVLLESGSVLPAGKVLLAAGAWSGTMGGLGHPIPVRPVRGQMVSLHPLDFPLDRVIESEEVYLVPREDGRLLVGATVEEVGFREGNTAGGIRKLLAAAIHLFPALEGSPLGEIWSGLRPATVDGHPIIGEDPEVRGLFHASGHYRNGVLLAPATARALAPLLADEVGEPIPEEFSPARF